MDHDMQDKYQSNKFLFPSEDQLILFRVPQTKKQLIKLLYCFKNSPQYKHKQLKWSISNWNSQRTKKKHAKNFVIKVYFYCCQIKPKLAFLSKNDDYYVIDETSSKFIHDHIPTKRKQKYHNKFKYQLSIERDIRERVQKMNKETNLQDLHKSYKEINILLGLINSNKQIQKMSKQQSEWNEQDEQQSENRQTKGIKGKSRKNKREKYQSYIDDFGGGQEKDRFEVNDLKRYRDKKVLKKRGRKRSRMNEQRDEKGQEADLLKRENIQQVRYRNNEQKSQSCQMLDEKVSISYYKKIQQDKLIQQQQKYIKICEQQQMRQQDKIFTNNNIKANRSVKSNNKNNMKQQLVNNKNNKQLDIEQLFRKDKIQHLQQDIGSKLINKQIINDQINNQLNQYIEINSSNHQYHQQQNQLYHAQLAIQQSFNQQQYAQISKQQKQQIQKLFKNRKSFVFKQLKKGEYKINSKRKQYNINKQVNKRIFANNNKQMSNNNQVNKTKQYQQHEQLDNKRQQKQYDVIQNNRQQLQCNKVYNKIQQQCNNNKIQQQCNNKIIKKGQQQTQQLHNIFEWFKSISYKILQSIIKTPIYKLNIKSIFNQLLINKPYSIIQYHHLNITNINTINYNSIDNYNNQIQNNNLIQNSNIQIQNNNNHQIQNNNQIQLEINKLNTNHVQQIIKQYHQYTQQQINKINNKNYYLWIQSIYLLIINNDLFDIKLSSSLQGNYQYNKSSKLFTGFNKFLNNLFISKKLQNTIINNIQFKGSLYSHTIYLAIYPLKLLKTPKSFEIILAYQISFKLQQKLIWFSIYQSQQSKHQSQQSKQNQLNHLNNLNNLNNLNQLNDLNNLYNENQLNNLNNGKNFNQQNQQLKQNSINNKTITNKLFQILKKAILFMKLSKFTFVYTKFNYNLINALFQVKKQFIQYIKPIKIDFLMHIQCCKQFINQQLLSPQNIKYMTQLSNKITSSFNVQGIIKQSSQYFFNLFKQIQNSSNKQNSQNSQNSQNKQTNQIIKQSNQTINPRQIFQHYKKLKLIFSSYKKQNIQTNTNLQILSSIFYKQKSIVNIPDPINTINEIFNNINQFNTFQEFFPFFFTIFSSNVNTINNMFNQCSIIPKHFLWRQCQFPFYDNIFGNNRKNYSFVSSLVNNLHHGMSHIVKRYPRLIIQTLYRLTYLANKLHQIPLSQQHKKIYGKDIQLQIALYDEDTSERFVVILLRKMNKNEIQKQQMNDMKKKRKQQKRQRKNKTRQQINQMIRLNKGQKLKIKDGSQYYSRLDNIKKRWYCQCKYYYQTGIPCQHQIYCTMTYKKNLYNQISKKWKIYN